MFQHRFYIRHGTWRLAPTHQLQLRCIRDIDNLQPRSGGIGDIEIMPNRVIFLQHPRVRQRIDETQSPIRTTYR